LGVEVVDERPYELQRTEGGNAYIYDFGLRYAADVGPLEQARQNFCDAFAAAWQGEAESDAFDRLVLGGGLRWRQVVVLRAYARYLRQTGTTFSQDYVESCLSAHVGITQQLVALVEDRLSPSRFTGPDGARLRDQVTDEVARQIRASLDDVASLDHD